jgi:hypothetical protein
MNDTNMISIFALILSIISIFWTIYNQIVQNIRWAKLNAANPGIREIKMLPFKQITRQEAEKIDWGYNANIYSTDKIDIFVLPYFLCARDPFGKVIGNINPTHTFVELENELSRIGYDGQVQVSKQFRPILIIENFGKTNLNDLFINIDIDNNGEVENAFKSNSKVSLFPSQTISINFEIDVPINPKELIVLNFTLIISYLDFNNKEKAKKIGMKWLEAGNSWSYNSLI